MPAIFSILSLKHEFIQHAIFCDTLHPLPRTLRRYFQSLSRPIIWQALEIEMNRSGGINSFFTPGPHHPDHSFCTTQAARYQKLTERQNTCLQVSSRHNRECSGGKIRFHRASIAESMGTLKEDNRRSPKRKGSRAYKSTRASSTRPLISRTPIRSNVIPPKS
jgi:hypothetical protein